MAWLLKNSPEMGLLKVDPFNPVLKRYCFGIYEIVRFDQTQDAVSCPLLSKTLGVN